MEDLQGNRPFRVVGRYALYGRLASGGMATVHFGRLLGPAGFSRTVAIKRLHPQFAKDPEFVAMFLDEARLAARIQHPNVVATVDVVAREEELFLVMDYIRGESFSRLLKASRRLHIDVPVGVITGIVSGMLHGLHAAHEAKDEQGRPLAVVHRDVSPQNVLVGVDGVARVLDFGVAKAAARVQVTRDGQMKGKLSYMAPEQLQAKGVDRRTDVFAAGIVLWEALTGRRLFDAEHASEVLRMILSEEIPPPSAVVPSIARSIDEVVMKALSRDPDDRYATARAFGIAVEEAVQGASPREVGEWVEKVAGDTLLHRERAVAEMEATPTVSDASLVTDSSPGFLKTLDDLSPVAPPADPSTIWDEGPTSVYEPPRPSSPSSRLDKTSVEVPRPPFASDPSFDAHAATDPTFAIPPGESTAITHLSLSELDATEAPADEPASAAPLATALLATALPPMEPVVVPPHAMEPTSESVALTPEDDAPTPHLGEVSTDDATPLLVEAIANAEQSTPFFAEAPPDTDDPTPFFKSAASTEPVPVPVEAASLRKSTPPPKPAWALRSSRPPPAMLETDAPKRTIASVVPTALGLAPPPAESFDDSNETTTVYNEKPTAPVAGDVPHAVVPAPAFDDDNEDTSVYSGKGASSPTISITAEAVLVALEAPRRSIGADDAKPSEDVPTVIIAEQSRPGAAEALPALADASYRAKQDTLKLDRRPLSAVPSSVATSQERTNPALFRRKPKPLVDWFWADPRERILRVGGVATIVAFFGVFFATVTLGRKPAASVADEATVAEPASKPDLPPKAELPSKTEPSPTEPLAREPSSAPPAAPPAEAAPVSEPRTESRVTTRVDGEQKPPAKRHASVVRVARVALPEAPPETSAAPAETESAAPAPAVVQAPPPPVPLPDPDMSDPYAPIENPYSKKIDNPSSLASPPTARAGKAHAGAPPADCATPYYTDDHGIRHPRPECL
ncbi:MAG TPA: protein kinase [Polyangiaceae bacterium]|nr:protein kinase [Polyangiaceae bacterium]